MRTTETVGEFLWCEIGNGLVSKNEIVKCLSNPIEKKNSSSRKGKLIFNIDEIKDFLDNC